MNFVGGWGIFLLRIKRVMCHKWLFWCQNNGFWCHKHTIWCQRNGLTYNFTLNGKFDVIKLTFLSKK